MRIGLVREDPTGQHLDTLGRRVGGWDRRAIVGFFRLGLLLEGVANRQRLRTVRREPRRVVF